MRNRSTTSSRPCTCPVPERMAETPDDAARCAACGGLIPADLELCADCGHGADLHDRRAEDGSCELCDDAAHLGVYAPCATIERGEEHTPNADGTACRDCGLPAEPVAPDELAAALMAEIGNACPWRVIDTDECHTIRERAVAGRSDAIPPCPIHGAHPDAS